MTDLRQDAFTIQMEGTVIPPPDWHAVLAKIETAAHYKQQLTLTPGEARILNNHLEEN